MPIADAPAELVAGGPPPGAAWLNSFVAFLQSCRISIDPHSGLTGTTGPGGTTVGYQDTPDIAVMLTYVGAAAGSYSWIEQVPASGGGWTNGFREGYTTDDPARAGTPADPAWEANLNAAIATGYKVEASRDAAVGRLSFRAGVCS
jgi:hypothetical protein